jgi:hypothetical protein
VLAVHYKAAGAAWRHGLDGRTPRLRAGVPGLCVASRACGT